MIGTLDELEPMLRARGFTHVRTMGGPIPIDTFDPYGCRRVGSLNLKPAHVAMGCKPWTGTILEIEGTTYLADAREATAPFLRGLFPLIQPSTD